MFRNVETGALSSWLQEGPQFWMRSGEWSADKLPEARQHELAVDGHGALVGSDALGTVTLSLRRDGLVLTGSIVDDQCYQRREASLTCWSGTELFGSPWAGVAGTLPAHFDWESGECVGADGKPALNVLPVEVVRETSFGECVDFSGQSLNGDDLGYPELQGWFLPGAKLDGASLFFANLTFATLNGADLSGLDFGYATVSGSFDDNTTFPDEGGCVADEGNPWSGPSVACTR
jgi:hypothetical protein